MNRRSFLGTIIGGVAALAASQFLPAAPKKHIGGDLYFNASRNMMWVLPEGLDNVEAGMILAVLDDKDTVGWRHPYPGEFEAWEAENRPWSQNMTFFNDEPEEHEPTTLFSGRLG